MRMGGVEMRRGWAIDVACRRGQGTEVGVWDTGIVVKGVLKEGGDLVF